jgi:uncharacterized protein
MAGKFEIKQSESGKYSFNLKAGNSQVILTSQMYDGKDGALNGIESVKTNAPDDANYERKTSTAGEPFFNLKATNGQIIGKSEMYSSDTACENGIESVKTNGPTAEIADTTVG